MVKESFTTGNSEVSRRDMASYLMRWLLVDKLQGEVTPFGSVRACQKIFGFGSGCGEWWMRSCGKVSVSCGGLRPDTEFSGERNPESGIGAGVAKQTPSRGPG